MFFLVQSSSALKKKKGEKIFILHLHFGFNGTIRRFYQWAHPLIRLLHIWCSHKAFKKGPYAVLLVGHTCSADVKAFYRHLVHSCTICVCPPGAPHELTSTYRSLRQIENDSCILIHAAFQNDRNSCQPRREPAYPPLVAEKLKKCCLWNWFLKVEPRSVSDM